MATSSIESMITTLFTAPGRAALEAEAGYRKIWADWLTQAKKFVGDDLTALQKMMPSAPVMKVSGVLELAVSMRVAEISGLNGSLSLGAGPISVSGGYFRQSSEESALTARGTFTLTNTEVDLQSYLARAGIELTDPAKLDLAIKQLQTGQLQTGEKK
jgi:hypothetical protein